MCIEHQSFYNDLTDLEKAEGMLLLLLTLIPAVAVLAHEMSPVKAPS